MNSDGKQEGRFGMVAGAGECIGVMSKDGFKNARRDPVGRLLPHRSLRYLCSWPAFRNSGQSDVKLRDVDLNDRDHSNK